MEIEYNILKRRQGKTTKSKQKVEELVSNGVPLENILVLVAYKESKIFYGNYYFHGSTVVTANDFRNSFYYGVRNFDYIIIDDLDLIFQDIYNQSDKIIDFCTKIIAFCNTKLFIYSDIKLDTFKYFENLMDLYNEYSRYGSTHNSIYFHLQNIKEEQIIKDIQKLKNYFLVGTDIYPKINYPPDSKKYTVIYNELVGFVNQRTYATKIIYLTVMKGEDLMDKINTLIGDVNIQYIFDGHCTQTKD